MKQPVGVDQGNKADGRIMTRNDARLIERLRSLVEVVVQEARSNQRFADRLGEALNANVDGASEDPRSRHRRKPPVLDPFAIYENSEQELRQSLEQLDLDGLKDIVAAHGMDRSRLAVRWKIEGRLVHLIIETVKTRARKGDVVRA
jgi:hypothetical protein